MINFSENATRKLCGKIIVKPPIKTTSMVLSILFLFGIQKLALVASSAEKP